MPGKLTYFDFGGFSAAIRSMLDHASFEFEDERLSFEEFGARKASLPLGSMPVWTEDGFVITQSSAILRTMGIRLGYYTEDPMIAWQIDSIVDYMDSMTGKCHDWILPAVMGGTSPDESKTDEWFSGYWDKVIPVLEARLQSHGKKFLGGTDRPTIADFKAFSSVSHVSSINPASIVPEATLLRLDQRIA